MLRLRTIAQAFVKAEVSNGKRTSFWFDSWTPLGPLINYFGDDGPRSLRLSLSSRVIDACNADGWKLPHPRSDAALNL